MESAMQKWYTDKTVLVTGATGSLGKMLVETLLRTCPNVRKIYLLVREKNGQDVQSRLHTFLNNQVFQIVKGSMGSTAMAEKLSVVHGDLECPGLGLLTADYERLTGEVEVVLHAGATVRFNESLRRAVSINVHGTREVCLLARNMIKLEAFVYISTAFSNCDKDFITESVTSSINLTPEALIDLIKSLKDRQLEEMTANIIGPKPNTYVYSKSAAEEVVRSFKLFLPAAIIRPSIVGATLRDPLPAWVEGQNGMTGFILGVLTGSLRVTRSERHAAANTVTLDYTANAVLALAYSTATSKNTFAGCSGEVPVVNYVSTSSNSVSWSVVTSLILQGVKQNPSESMLWYPFVINTSRPWLAVFLRFLLHFLPAAIVDLFSPKLRLKKTYQRIDKFVKSVEFFTTHDFQFEQRNAQRLWESLEERDKQLFPFNMAAISWPEYISSYVKGCKQFCLKQSPNPTPQAIRKLNRLYILHLTLMAVWTIFFVGVLWTSIAL